MPSGLFDGSARNHFFPKIEKIRGRAAKFAALFLFRLFQTAGAGFAATAVAACSASSFGWIHLKTTRTSRTLMKMEMSDAANVVVKTSSPTRFALRATCTRMKEFADLSEADRDCNRCPGGIAEELHDPKPDREFAEDDQGEHHSEQR